MKTGAKVLKTAILSLDIIKERGKKMMNGFWKLTNYLFGWMMQKKGAIVLTASLVFGILGMLVQSFPKAAAPGDYTHLAVSFMPYEMIVDKSGVVFVFLLGLLLLFLIIYLSANKFFTNGKGIYTLLMLPLKRNQIYFAFVTAALGMVILYFAAWLSLMVVMYFPVMTNYTKVAAEEVFRVSDVLTVQALDAARENGLYLAFRRSAFLSSCFPSSLWQLLALVFGVLLVLSSVLYGGLHVGDKGGQIMVMLSGIVLGVGTATVPLVFANELFNSIGFTIVYLFSVNAAQTSVGSTLVFCIPTLSMMLLVVKLSLKDIKGKMV